MSQEISENPTQSTALEQLEQLLAARSSLNSPHTETPAMGSLPVPDSPRTTGQPVLQVLPDMVQPGPAPDPIERKPYVVEARQRYERQREIAKQLQWPGGQSEQSTVADVHQQVQLPETEVLSEPLQPASVKPDLPKLQLQNEQSVLLAKQAEQAYSAAAEASRRRSEHVRQYRALAYAGRETLLELRKQGMFFFNVSMAMESLAKELERDDYYYYMYRNLGDMALKAATSEQALPQSRADVAYQMGGIVSGIVASYGHATRRADNFWTLQGRSAIVVPESDKGKLRRAA